ncbi:MAG: glycosyltransferase [Deltaproteobacteria bacterium]|nr:glycosyltransferase [Deltaproteobacteria bacterium]
MWLLIATLGIATVMVGWGLFAYFLVFAISGLLKGRRAPAPVAEDALPSVSIVVPCFNERADILAKLADVNALDYPRHRMEVVFADGGSTDGTADVLAKALDGDPTSRLARCAGGGKIRQVNEVLPSLRGDVVVNTDVDARLEPDAIRRLAAEFAADPDVAVVGAYARPGAPDGLALESYYWDAQNKGRFIESDAFSSSIVVAPCYAFRRPLLPAGFPEDVVADDVFVALQASTTGQRTVYSRGARAVETRVPSDVGEFVRHKFRKSNAFLRELLRFHYRLPYMSMPVKLMVVTRTVQMLLLPWLMLLWVLVAGSLLTLGRWEVVAIASVFLAALFVATSVAFGLVKLPDGQRPHGLFTVASGFVLTLFILMITAVTYPFYRQGSSYARLPRGGGA